MPELPDVVVYLEALDARVTGRSLKRASLLSPFVLRTVIPPIDALQGRTIRGVRRLGKRIVVAFDEELFLVVHLMIAGRLRWRAPGQKPGVSPRMVLASFEFDDGTLYFTGKKKLYAVGAAAYGSETPGLPLLQEQSAGAYLVVGGMKEAIVYFVTPSELKAKENSSANKFLRMGGMVVKGSLQKDLQTLTYRFDLTDGSTTFPVYFKGIPPDLFTEGKGAVVEGRIGEDGTFHATTLLAKCASRYENAPTETPGGGPKYRQTPGYRSGARA